MPQAGWCRECGEWVWLDEEGACQYGHGPECIGSVYDALPEQLPAPPLEVGFGVGEMPDGLYRFSWAAFTLPFFWAFVYGVWPILLLWLGSLLLPLVLGGMFGVDPKTTPVSVLVGVTVAAEAVNGLVRLWSGANAHTLLWRKEAVRLGAISGAKPRFGVRRFKSRQWTWIIVGWLLLISALIASVILNYIEWSKYGMGIAGAVEPLVFMGAEVWLGVWLSLKMREERPGLPGPHREPAEHSA